MTNLYPNFGQSATATLTAPESHTIIALYDFVASNNDELSFTTGDILIVKHNFDDGWITAELNGITGLVPGNYFVYDQS
ncbi:15582_t:CDS:2 [Dentiscutata erythropus]|uniref:15582_t:CDS:1 n=1 Tax=Dentiscutata erythropus TaxID=1348616 RepID=A0A9N8VCY0_9GLOM|nr:15582_t:CDS:2 [Dentiscutata erythropus]